MFKKLALVLVTLLTVALPLNAAPNNNKSSTKNGKPSYLFVILSNYGQIQQAPDGSYQLILNHGEVEKVLAFSDRPYRLVEHMTGAELQSAWNEGSNSFAEDPPNATVIINQHLQTIVLLNMKVVGDQTIFTIRADGPQSLLEMDGRVQIFVDGEKGCFCCPGFCCNMCS